MQHLHNRLCRAMLRSHGTVLAIAAVVGAFLLLTSESWCKQDALRTSFMHRALCVLAAWAGQSTLATSIGPASY